MSFFEELRGWIDTENGKIMEGKKAEDMLDEFDAT